MLGSFYKGGNSPISGCNEFLIHNLIIVINSLCVCIYMVFTVQSLVLVLPCMQIKQFAGQL